MALGFFPTPYPDELLYSVFARYAALVQYPSTEAVNVELFGRRSAAAIIELPSHLGYLTSQFPSGHQLTVSRLINEHSIYPYYSPFIGVRRVHVLRRAMEEGGGAIVHKIAGITASSVRPPERLRFCPQCVEVDRRKYAECYWHRLHQVAGLTVCPQHSIFLEESSIRARNRARSGMYVPAEQSVHITIPRPLDLSDPHRQALVDLTCDISWILSQNDLVMDCASLRECFLRALADKGLASAGGSVRVSRLLEVFKKRYPLELLRSLKCGFNAKNAYNWLPSIVIDLKRERGHTPLRYLLLIRAAGHTAESFFSLTIPPAMPIDDMPFGAGPFPCLNPVCGHYGVPVIKDCVIMNAWSPGKSLVGTFRCGCGFGYSRKATERSEEQRYKFDRPVSYGKVWEAALKRMWSDRSLSVNSIARKLSVDSKTVKHQATRLRLAFPRRGPSPNVMQANMALRKRVEHRRRLVSSMPKRLERYRNRWLAAMNKHPEATTVQLRRDILPKVYYNLMRHDREWLKAHMPPARKRARPSKTRDWPATDARLAEEVRSSALRLKEIDGRPKQVTRQAIARHLDKVSLLCERRRLGKLPLSHIAIAEVVEDRAAYYIRLIKWVAECFRQEDVSPSRSALIVRAGIPSDLKTSPMVKEAIDAAWLHLQTRMNSAATFAA